MEILDKIPELRFVVECIKSSYTVKEQETINTLADSTLNWDLVFEIAVKHRVFPILYKNIIPGLVPDIFFAKFKNTNYNNSTRNLYLSSFLFSCLSFLRDNSINALSFKGPILAQDIYGDLTLRSFSDLDILVKKKDACKAWNLFLKNQFSPVLILTKKQKQKYIDSEDHIAFSKGKIHIELHWELSGLYLSKPLTYDHVEKRLNTIQLDNQIILNLSPEDLIVYLCVHGAKHGWEYIEQVNSIAALLNTKKNMDWNYIEKLTKKLHCKRMYFLGLYLSWKLFRVPIPEFHLNELKMDEKIPKLAQEVTLSMFEDITDTKKIYRINRFSLFHIKVRDSFSDKLRYSLRLIFRATDNEWRNLPVPAPLSFIHYFYRPFRLLIRRVRGKHA